jgi:AGCS family alanine or glycine:cation symporter
MAFMAMINIPAIFMLKDSAIKCMKDYSEQKRAGKNPVFKASSIDLKDKVDFWQDTVKANK